MTSSLWGLLGQFLRWVLIGFLTFGSRSATVTSFMLISQHAQLFRICPSLKPWSNQWGYVVLSEMSVNCLIISLVLTPKIFPTIYEKGDFVTLRKHNELNARVGGYLWGLSISMGLSYYQYVLKVRLHDKLSSCQDGVWRERCSV